MPCIAGKHSPELYASLYPYDVLLLVNTSQSGESDMKINSRACE